MEDRHLNGPEVDQVFADETSVGQILWLNGDNQNSVVNVVAANPAGNTAQWSFQSYDAFGT